MAQPVILVVEDDDAIRRGLVDALEFGGYQVMACDRGDRALETALAADLDLILLDVVLPGKDGISVLDALRRTRPTLPVILVTARGSEDDRVNGLRKGADDYVVKPFSAKELLARVEAVLRRSPARPVPREQLQIANRTVRLDLGQVTLPDGEKRQLSEKEAAILRYLASYSDRTVSRDELLQRVWGLNPQGITTRTVDMHIARLREKLADNPQLKIIETIRFKGYRLGDAARWEA